MFKDSPKCPKNKAVHSTAPAKPEHHTQILSPSDVGAESRQRQVSISAREVA